MITTKTHAKFLEWFSADEMHQASKKWFSELSFIKDEQLFFDDLIKTYTLELLDEKNFAANKDTISALGESHKRNEELIEIIKTHRNDLEVMVDGINQPKEEASYKKEHKALILIISEFFVDYKNLKARLFQIIKDVLKSEKQNNLLNRE